jgi:arylformamidase
MDGHIVDLYERGWDVINVNYPLCPSVSLSRLYTSLERAMHYICKHLADWKMETNPIFFMGHSVGAHAVSYLAPRFQAKMSRLKGVVAVSGIYDIRIVQHISVQSDVRVSEEEATKFNLLEDCPPASSSSSTLPFMVVSGGNEPPFWIQQSELYAKKLLSERPIHADGVVISGVIPNTNHFSVLDEMVAPGTSWSKQLDHFISTHRKLG